METAASEHLPNGLLRLGQPQTQQSRADELDSLLRATLEYIIPFVRTADEEAALHRARSSTSVSINDHHSPSALDKLLTSDGTLDLPSSGLRRAGFESTLHSLLKYSVNTSAPGFMDKLYSAPAPIGIVADLVLSVLNTNLHVYHVSPVLTLIEKHVTKRLANMFGLTGPRAGGISVQGGSASNMTSIVVARNTLFPRTKVHGNGVDGLNLVLFTSTHGHYSIEKAAQACGFGAAAVVPVPVDPLTGRMLPSELENLILEANATKKTPFYVNATAGTTVMGSFDPFDEISVVAKKYGLWMHIDGAWGGSFVFSDKFRKEKLKGVELADSIALNPHKMMSVPVTCSFLLGQDLRQFHEANTLRAGYLFHDVEDEAEESRESGTANGNLENDWKQANDLADMTLQCGRRGDSLKMFMSWRYYGTEGYRERIERAYQVASYMADLLATRKNFILIGQQPPPCLQVCFYYAPDGQMMFGEAATQLRPSGFDNADNNRKQAMLETGNSKITETVTKRLLERGFMIDYAPALEDQAWKGKFFRAVVNISTPTATVERLVNEVEGIGRQVVREMQKALQGNK